MTKFTSSVTTNPDFDGFNFYIEKGRQFDAEVYKEAYGINVPQDVIDDLNLKAEQLKDGEWLNVQHEA
ncbi:TPA: hypothetical protein ACQTZU_001613 [Pseudomonas aeruginosa]|uniref:hypothetical protein n=1 Tax=Pseudomonas aeruginosa TaxID=287 RepID=UPI00053E31FB|nr:hypothetical protein [Pseudomonas aeruginosa]KRU53621.1 hypothetical protein AN449_30380 [Pseudomonas aeruginosa]MBG4002973.1 hypothetical protein [Pseudomonas aeruginosa]MBG4002984.1 hypothetical protein [Pseudomonas aeruginosa]WCI86290.1 hypothetical protein PMJ90_16680 [Pseudomonas aeruginosa]WCI86293.1 hypothetical protein PMJ90_16695 [Pseudomonas aeruginosa]